MYILNYIISVFRTTSMLLLIGLFLVFLVPSEVWVDAMGTPRKETRESTTVTAMTTMLPR